MTNSFDAPSRRVVAVSGSPHTDGVSSRLLTAFLTAFDEQDVTVFRCFDENPLPCDDCGFCREQNGCCKPDLDGLFAALEQADVLVFASPVYNRAFPAPMKALIDRFQRYWSARFVQGKPHGGVARQKQAVLLTACGSDDALAGERLREQLAPALTVVNARIVDTVDVTATDRADEDALGRACEQAVTLGRRIAGAENS